MVHFVTNLQHYIMFEVLQTSWMKLSQELPEAADLDSVIRAHNEFVFLLWAQAHRSKDLDFRHQTIAS